MKILESTMFNTAAFPHSHRHLSIRISIHTIQLHIASTHIQDTHKTHTATAARRTTFTTHLHSLNVRCKWMAKIMRPGQSQNCICQVICLFFSPFTFHLVLSFFTLNFSILSFFLFAQPCSYELKIALYSCVFLNFPGLSFASFFSAQIFSNLCTVCRIFPCVINVLFIH